MGQEREEVQALIAAACREFERRAAENASAWLDISPQEFEKVVAECLEFVSTPGTPFHRTIQHIGGQRFPDIVIGDPPQWGVEVKTIRHEGWSTAGNSVREGTRVEGLKDIFIIACRLGNPTQIRWAPYESVIEDVKVTHSPRYFINMELPALGDAQGFFQRTGGSYLAVSESEEPIRTVVELKLKEVEDPSGIWWASDREDEALAPMALRQWRDLDSDEQRVMVGEGFSLFPELLGPGSQDKYRRVGGWWVTRRYVIAPSLRDCFSAGGKVEVTVGGVPLRVPQVLERLRDHGKVVAETLRNQTDEVIGRFWPTDAVQRCRRGETREEVWTELAASRAWSGLNEETKQKIHDPDVLKSWIAQSLV